MTRKTITINEQGEAVERQGKAGPELLRADLRQLPSELLTKEVPVASKVHALDDPHVKNTIVREYADKMAGKLSPEEELPEGAERVQRVVDATLTQERIDIVRLRVMNAIAKNSTDIEDKLRVYHLWFPRNDINEYQLRTGNPPSDSARPKHLRAMQLHIDLGSGKLPPTVVDKLPLARLQAYNKHLERMRQPKEEPRIIMPGLPR